MQQTLLCLCDANIWKETDVGAETSFLLQNNQIHNDCISLGIEIVKGKLDVITQCD